jgi:hypothetical protein
MALGSGVRLPLEPRALRATRRPSAPRLPARTAPRVTPPDSASPVALAAKQRAPRLPVRLRLVLALLLAGLAVGWLAPRAKAYWNLHDAATRLSDYAVCMVGSGGPELLWERPRDFWRLARRRLISSPPDARPFTACVTAAEALTDARVLQPAYQARAADFVEYQTTHAAAATFTLDHLQVSTDRFSTLVDDAWPLLSKSPRQLLRPSLRARSAPAVSLELPPPGAGRGLPAADLGYAAVKPLEDGYLLATGRDANLTAYWSRDGGLTWSQTNPEHLEHDLRLGSCALAGSSTSFRLSASGDLLQLESWQQAQLGTSVALAPAEQRLLAFSCDSQGAVAIFSDESRRDAATFRLCPAFEHCRDLPLPAALAGASAGSIGLSAARARGATILAVTHGGIVRVFSSRDDGRTWTPPVVAYDASDAATAVGRSDVPTRLLSLGGRVLLYAGATASRREYAVLASDDLGASWRAP